MGLADRGHADCRLGLLRRTGASIGLLVQVVQRILPVGASRPTCQVDGPVRGDPVEPRAERCVPPIAGQRLPRDDIGVLGDVFGVVMIAEQSKATR